MLTPIGLRIELASFRLLSHIRPCAKLDDLRRYARQRTDVPCTARYVCVSDITSDAGTII
jgi:hypothetical protein